MKPLVWKHSPFAAIFVAFTLAGAQSAHAVNAAWNTDAATGNFGSPNWTSGVTAPAAGGTYTVVSGDALFFGTSATTTLNNNLSGASYAGLIFNSGASAFTIGGNSFTLAGNITNNSASTQTINNNIVINGARTFNAANGQLILGGNLSGNTGTTTLSGNNKITLSGTNNLTMTANFGGLIINGAGGVDITGATTINGAAGNTFSGYMNVNGNATLRIQAGGSLAINATSNASKPDSGIGNNVTGTSTVLVNGGSLTYSGEQGLMIGNNRADATGVLTVSSGTATINAGSTTATDIRSFVAMGRDGANGVVNLDGGTLETGRRFVRDGSGGGTAGTGTANFNFNGGVLKALADQTSGNGWFETATTGNFQVVTTTVKAGGAKIDTNGFNANINTVLAHDSGLGGTADGGLTKSGTGTLTLGAANTYTGATNINAGTLALAATGSLTSTQLSVSNGATFNVSAVTGYQVGSGVTLTNNGTVAGDVTVNGTVNGSGTFTGAVTVNGAINPGNSPGSVTFTNGLALAAGSNLGWELIANTESGAGTNFDQILVTGGALSIADGATLNLAFGGTVDFTDTFWSTDRSWTVISFNGEGDEGALTLGSITGGAGNFNEFGSFSTSNDNGNQVLTWTAVPEPTAALLGGLGMLGLLRRRRSS